MLRFKTASDKFSTSPDKSANFVPFYSHLKETPKQHIEVEYRTVKSALFREVFLIGNIMLFAILGVCG